MRPNLDERAPELPSLVDLTITALLAGARLPGKMCMRTVWRLAWGKCAYGDGVSDDELKGLTRVRKNHLQLIFDQALVAVRQAVEKDSRQASALRQQVVAHRANASPLLAVILFAIEAALDLLWLDQHTREKGLSLRLALCYSAFGDILAGVTEQAQELGCLFHNVAVELHIFAVAGIDDTTTVPAEIDSVHIHARQVGLAELVAFPGIKAPGLLGACADAVSHGADLVVTIDGDGRLPLWQIIPAIAAMTRSPAVDAVLGSRRIAGAVVSKPGLRHWTSMLNAAYVEILMGPVMGVVRDPQSVFKVYRGSRLDFALKRLGRDEVHGWSLNGLQDGSLATELMILANLAVGNRRPQILEVPAVESMVYVADPGRMLILTGGHVRQMMAAANRPRKAVRERSLLGEGTEVVVIRRSGNDVVKLPRLPERLATRGLLPTSEVADNRLVDFAMSFKGAIRTVMCSLAAGSHADRGFGINQGAIDLIHDDRPQVKRCLPASLGHVLLDEAIRLPFPSSIVLRTFWRIDRWFWASGALLERIGMLPLILVRIIGRSVRVARLIGRLLRLILRPVKTLILRVASRVLRLRDLLAPLVRRYACRVVTVLELAGVLRPFAVLDRLDQRNRVFHACLRGLARVLIECRWSFLESFNVSVHFGRPVPCILQQEPLRPLWSVLEALPVSMTGEIHRLLNEAVAVYRSLGEVGYYDGELSLDNLGLVLNNGQTRAVLIDYGAVVNARRCQPTLLRQWLRGISDDFSQSFAIFKLRRYAQGNRRTQQAVDTYVRQCLELVDQWGQQPWILE